VVGAIAQREYGKLEMRQIERAGAAQVAALESDAIVRRLALTVGAGNEQGAAGAAQHLVIHLVEGHHAHRHMGFEQRGAVPRQLGGGAALAGIGHQYEIVSRGADRFTAARKQHMAERPQAQHGISQQCRQHPGHSFHVRHVAAPYSGRTSKVAT